jgi:ATP-binding cassette subfamily B (MDR/TAP) protein 1
MKISEGDSRQVIETGIIDSPVPFDYSQDQSLNNDIKPVWFFQMFRYADWFDWILIILGLFSTISSGVGIAWYSEPYGELTQAMAPNADKNVIANQVRGAVYGFLKNAAVVFVSTWIMSNVWSISSERQAIKCRIQYLKAILRQEPMWHDKQRSTEVAEKMYNETKNLQNAIGGRVPAFLMSLSQVIGGFVIALTRGWKMALVMMSFIPLMFIARWAGAKMNNYSSDSANKVQNRLAGNSLEVLENIRTVKALGGEYYETTRYEKTLNNWKSSVGKCAILRVFISTVHFFCIIMNYTLGFWYGSILITNG